MSAELLMGKRREQLVREEKLDHLLQEHCPRLMTQFFLTQRAYNRHLTEKLYDAPWYAMPSLYSDQLDRVDHIQESLLQASDISVCVRLSRSVKHMQDQMKK